MFEELERLISFMESIYEEITNIWTNDKMYLKINMKSMVVKKLSEDNEEKENIMRYRQFLNDRALGLTMSFESLKLSCVVDTRIKARNSIEYKIYRYIQEHSDGEIPINKCFNDLFGVRIILDNYIEYEKIKEYINNRKSSLKLKCIKADKKEYIATHIYFKKDNFTFPWELQVWSKSNRDNNFISHAKYKQDYAKWEKENKEGDKNDNTLHNIK